MGVFGVFSEYKPKAALEARPSAKNPRGRKPRGFLAKGLAKILAEDAAEGLPEENPEGYFQSTPLGINLELDGLPERTDSPHYTEAFQQIVILTKSLFIEMSYKLKIRNVQLKHVELCVLRPKLSEKHRSEAE